jgi:hypothetical protein
MTQAQLHDLLHGLPYGLEQQIVGYVGAVRDKLPEIFHDAGIQENEALTRGVLLVALMRKLNGIVATAFWTTDNCLEELGRSQITSFRIGGTTYERDSPDMESLQLLRAELDTFMAQQNMTELIELPYQQVVEALANG